LRSTRELPSFPEMAAEGEPGAHVLAVVPAHRDTYAEVRGRCRLQISSRNALQKQRSDESEREPRWVAVPGFSRGSVHRRSIATPARGGQRPRRRRKAQGGVMSATRRHGLSREDRVACLARCGFGRPRMPETSASEGSSRMEVALGCRSRLSSRMGRWKRSWWANGTRLVRSCGNMRRIGSGSSGVYDGSDRGDILRKPKKLQNAPKRVWRRETLHALEGRVSLRPNAVRQGGWPTSFRRSAARTTPPSNRAKCGYTLRQSRLADIGRIHLGASLSWSSRVVTKR
jgi:hypothetical protein